MNELLKKVRTMGGEGCVTITMNTHPTLPGRKSDPAVLKKLVSEAESRLYDLYDKRLVWSIMENLNRVAGSVAWDNNDRSLVIFANREFGDSTRLPVDVSDRVTIDTAFATGDIIRAMQQELSYYILILNRNEARLVEAFNGKAVREFDGEFPLTNPLFPADNLEKSMKEGSDNYINEFFNQVDKALWDAVKDARKPILLATESRNFDYFMSNTDHPDMVLGYMPVNGDAQPVHDIVDKAWEAASEMIREGNIARVSELREAAGLLTEGLTDIWNAISEGRAATLFVRKGFHQPARIVPNPDSGDYTVIPTGEAFINEKGVMDDIVDDMIAQTLESGGEVVFVDGDQLEEFGNLALVARYSLAEARA